MRVMYRLFAIGLFMVSLGVTVGCSGDSPTAADVQIDPLASFEEILVSRWTGTVEPSLASLVVDTKEGVICTWTYGTTTDYGVVATHVDPSMATTHTHHNVVLTGLEPDTLYHYRFVAVDSNGIVYRSADSTFQTPPE